MGRLIPLNRMAFLAVAIVLATLGASYSYWQSLLATQRTELAGARARNEMRVAQLNEAVEQQLDAMVRSVDVALKHLRGIYVRNPKEFDRAARDVLSAYPAGMLQFVTVFGADGHLAYSSGEFSGPAPYFGDREHFSVHAQTRDDRLFISKPIVGRLSGVPLIQLTRAIRDGDRFLGVIGIPMRPEYLSGHLGALRISPADLLSIVRLDGSIIARSHNLAEGLRTVIPADRPFFGAAPGEKGIFRAVSTVDHVPLLFSWRRLEEWPLIAVTAIDEAAEIQTLSRQHETERNGALLSMGGIVLAVLGICLLVMRIDRTSQAVSRSEARQRALFETAGEGIHVLDEDGRLVDCNQSFAAMLGYSESEARGLCVTDWEVQIPLDEILDTIRLLMREPRRFETRHRRKDGSVIDVELTAKGFEIGGRNFLYAASRDITERKRVEAELRIAATAFESQEGMLVTDADNVILRVNRAFSRITGYAAEEVVGRRNNFLKSGRHDAAFYAELWASLLRDGFWQGEIWNRRRSGEVYPEWLTITAVKGPAGEITHYVGTLTDITSRKAAEDEIQHLAFYDPLTRLPNRRLLLDRLQQAIAASARNRQEGAVLFIDLDNFKTLNDTLGHDVGDLLLQEVGRRLSASVRKEDTVARLGGDEFVVMLKDLSAVPKEAAAQTEVVVDKIRAALNEPYLFNGHPHHCSPSIGAVLFEGYQYSAEELMKRADLAMYQAKAAGRNTLRFFDPEMQAAISARARLEGDLRRGLQARQFILCYQPQVDAAGRVTGAEALVRWQHPERGLLLPGEFIPLAEESGLILQLGQWVLTEACAQLVAWSACPALDDLTLAINVSAREFRQSDYVDQVIAVLERSGADPHKLKLELTESMLLHDVEDIIRKMKRLKALGVSFSLDDFGTGYSSLNYLKQLPLDQLKIDRSFVQEVLTDANDAAIASTIVALTQYMGLAVIAEGVETEAQRNILGGLGCTAFQGYLFGGALPLEEFAKRCKA